MFIRTRCPACESFLSAPGELQGKRVRCPKCGDSVMVPGPVAYGESRKASGGPERGRSATRPGGFEERPRRYYDDDGPRRGSSDYAQDERSRHWRSYDYDEEEERPRRRRRPRQQSNLGLILGCVIGGALLLFVGVGVALWLVLSDSPEQKPGGQNPRDIAAAKDRDPKPPPPRNVDALAFNEKFVEGNKRLAAAGFQLGVATKNYIEQGGRNAQMLEAECQRAIEAVEALRKTSQTWAVPPAQSAQNLYDGYQRFLQFEKAELEKIQQVVKSLALGKLTLWQKQQRLAQAIRQLESAERAQLAEVQGLQQRFAQDHGIILRPPGNP